MPFETPGSALLEPKDPPASAGGFFAFPVAPITTLTGTGIASHRPPCYRHHTSPEWVVVDADSFRLPASWCHRQELLSMNHRKNRLTVFFAAIVSVVALAGGASRCGAPPEGSGGHMWNVINPLDQPR